MRIMRHRAQAAPEQPPDQHPCEDYLSFPTQGFPSSSVLGPSRSGDPPWILKRAGLESSGGIAYSSYWKNRRIAFLCNFFCDLFIFLFLDKKKVIFQHFCRFLYQKVISQKIVKKLSKIKKVKK